MEEEFKKDCMDKLESIYNKANKEEKEFIDLLIEAFNSGYRRLYAIEEEIKSLNKCEINEQNLWVTIKHIENILKGVENENR